MDDHLTPVPGSAASSAGRAGAMPAGAFDPALTALVEQAIADLARRQSVRMMDITIVDARSITWPDRGLGCPQPGMAYPQVPVDGLLIRLRIGSATFNYHGGAGKAPFLCDQPMQAAPLPGSG